MSAAEETMQQQLQVMNDEREQMLCDAVGAFYAHVAWGISVGDMKDVETLAAEHGLDLGLVRDAALRLVHGRTM